MAAAREMVSNRETYGRTLLDMAEDHPDIVVLGGDLNVSVFTHLWRDQHPDRFFDFGPSEQNLIAVGAGLAASGKIPSFSPLPVFGVGRPFDQLRVLVAQPHLNLKLVCTHAGILTGEDGMSAQGIEDLALACSLPGFSVICPSDSVETAQAVRAAAAVDGPMYIRLPRAATPVVHDGDYVFTPGRAEVMRQGRRHPHSDRSNGFGEPGCCRPVGRVGIQARVINMHTLAPADEATILAAARETEPSLPPRNTTFTAGWAASWARRWAKAIPFRWRWWRCGVMPSRASPKS